MEFGEKLQQLRKSKGLTQEELAEALYVSRTAVSKWESGRGYPSIDSLKEIAGYFSVSIDALLSGETLLYIAQKENSSNIRNLCDLLFGIVDFFSCLLIVLPIYPKTIDGHVFSVNLAQYTETTLFNRSVYWAVFLVLTLIGTLSLLLTYLKITKYRKILTTCSMLLSAAAVCFLALTRGTYALILIFLLLAAKGILLFRQLKAER